MNQALNQDEINDLMKKPGEGDNVVNHGILAVPKTYDLTNQEISIYSVIDALSSINERFAKNIKISLTNFLRKTPEIIVQGIKVSKFDEYIHSLFIPTSINIVQVQPLNGLSMFVIDAKLVFSLVDNYFGGKGLPSSKTDITEFTPTECRIVKIILEQFFKDLSESWSPILELKLAFKRMEINPSVLNIYSPHESMLVSRFTIDINGNGGDFHICMPAALINPIRETLNHTAPEEQKHNDTEWMQSIREKILEAPLELNCILAKKKISIKDIVNFKVNDVFQIDIPEEVVLRANDISLFRANFGTFEGKYAIKIIDREQKQQLEDKMETEQIDPNKSASQENTNKGANTKAADPAQFNELSKESKKSIFNNDKDLGIILDIPVTLSLEVGKTSISIKNLLQLNQGSVVELDRAAGEPLDVLVNGTLVAHAEVVVVNDKFGIRLTDVISTNERMEMLK